MASRRKAARKGPLAWTEARRAENQQGRLTVRLPLDVLAMLDGISERTGYTKSYVIEGYIRQEHADLVGAGPQRPTRRSKRRS